MWKVPSLCFLEEKYHVKCKSSDKCQSWLCQSFSGVFMSVHTFSDLPLEQRIYQCPWLKADRNPCPIVNLKCRHDLLSSLFPVSHSQKDVVVSARKQSLKNTQPDKLNCHVHVFFFNTWLLCLPGQPFIWSQVWNKRAACILKKWQEWSNYIWQAFQCDWGKRTLDGGGSKWAVTLNDTGILFLMCVWLA